MYDSFFMRWLAPGFASGVSVGLWLRLLAENRFRVECPYIGRAAAITGVAILNSLGGWAERLVWGRGIRRATVPAPLFVLGLPRSGTTHLHNLLSRDPRFAFPNTFQTMNPRIFLLTEKWLAACQQAFLPATRPMDSMYWSVETPAEDEFAMMGLSGLSPFASWLFPRNHRRYDRYLDFSNASAEEQRCWKQALFYFLKKMHCRDSRPLILKSPFHTARIPLLLELFPDAKFVLIHRHPFEVYVSGVHTTRVGLPVSTLQRWDIEMQARRTEEVCRRLLDSYFEHRSLIPDGHLVEVGFEQVERSPLATLRSIYERLSLPPFAVAEPAFTEYLASIGDYRRNAYAQLDPEIKSRLVKDWRRGFEEWGYEA